MNLFLCSSSGRNKRSVVLKNVVIKISWIIVVMGTVKCTEKCHGLTETEHILIYSLLMLL